MQIPSFKIAFCRAVISVAGERGSLQRAAAAGDNLWV